MCADSSAAHRRRNKFHRASFLCLVFALHCAFNPKPINALVPNEGASSTGVGSRRIRNTEVTATNSLLPPPNTRSESLDAANLSRARNNRKQNNRRRKNGGYEYSKQLEKTSFHAESVADETDGNGKKEPKRQHSFSDGPATFGAADMVLPEKIPRLSDLLSESDESRVKSMVRPISGHRKKSNRKYVNRKAPSRNPSSRNGQNKTSTQPWRADFKTSIRTQGRIKKAFSVYSKGESPNLRAKRILKELLSTPPSQCNAANVVGALTFSCKALGTRQVQPDAQLRQMLFDTMEILHTLVNQRLLSTRQLCNACWAIAKHHDRDDSLLPPPPEATALSSESVVGTAEQWYIEGNPANLKNLESQQMVDDTVDEIARQLTDVLNKCFLEESCGHVDNQATAGNGMADRDDQSTVSYENTSAHLPAKIGEICMASWAYGKLRPRSTPPGWQIPPQLGKFPSAKSHAQQLAQTTNMITFEQWGSFGESTGENARVITQDEQQNKAKTTELLFDAIGTALWQSPGGKSSQPSSESNEQISEEAEKAPRTGLELCTWSELANVAWSYASHGSCKSFESERLLLTLAREARYRLEVGGDAIEGLLIRDIAQLLWALGTLQADNFRLADDLVYLVEALTKHLRLGARSPSFGRRRPLRKWSCADLVQVALSLAHARIDELALLRTIYEESHYRLMEGLHENLNEPEKRVTFRPWEVSVLLWAQARLHLKSGEGVEFDEFSSDAPKFFLKAVSKDDSSLQSIGVGTQERANIAWALTVLEQHRSVDAVELMNRLFHEAAEACEEEHTIQLEHAHQLWQAYFLLEDESPECVKDVPIWFANYLQDKWTLEKARDKISSARHRAISQTLQLMGVDHFNEHDEDIDVAIVLKGGASWTHQTEAGGSTAIDRVSVAVEFDGPNHFTRERDSAGHPQQPRALGHTVLKYRLLKKQGWSVVRVPYFEFDRIPFWASMERQRYLQRKLKTHSSLKFSEADVSEYQALKPNRESRFE